MHKSDIISKRVFFKFFAFTFSLLTGLDLCAQKPPNIVIIISDDHAYQSIGAYGSKLMKTPAIDRIAKEGVLFNKAFVTNSLCGPSRAVILTGKYSHKNGFRDNVNDAFDGSQNSFIKELSKNGYQTAWIGKWHLQTKPQGFSFWQVLPGQGSYYNPDFLLMDSSKIRVEGYVSNVIEDIAENWLDQRDSTKPFCLVIGHKATHRTWLPDTTDMGLFDNVKFPLPKNFYDNYNGRQAAAVQDMTIAKTMILGYDLKMYDSIETMDRDGSINRMNAAQRAKTNAYYRPIAGKFKSLDLKGNALTEWKYQRYMNDYLSTAASLDRNINRTLDYLDKHNLSSNTIVIYMSDQGFYLGEHGWFDKRFIYEESFRTPMVMRYPGTIKPNTVSNDLVMNLDLGPTLLEAAGVDVPSEMQGESFLPVLKKERKGRDAMYYHYYENGEHAVSPHFGIRTERYKLVRFYQKVESWELYDLKNDKWEMKNLYGAKGYEKITADLKARLDDLIDEYEDGDAKRILENASKSF